MISFSAYTQGINFEHGDWASVKLKAQQENKIIFIDFYTSWCGPCKQMAKNIFPLENVGEFYNKNFVCYKLDAEKGEGVKLAKHYGVRAYPTYVFANSDGEFLHQGSGSISADDFINLGKVALNPNTQLVNLTNGDKEISKKDMPGHLQELYDKRLPYNEKFKAYIQSLSPDELISQQTFDLIKKFGGRAAKGFAYETVVKSKLAYEERLGKQKLENYFYRKMLNRVYEYKGRKESYKPVFEEASNLGYELEEKIEATLLINGYFTNKPTDFEGFVNECKQFLAAYEAGDTDLKNYPVFTIASGRLLRNKVLDAYTFQLLEEMDRDKLEMARAYGTIGNQYFKANRLDKVFEYFNKALYSAKEKGQDTEVWNKNIEHVKERIQIVKKGDYTLNGKGFEPYNGLSVKLWYYSPTNIGKIEESDKVTIENGKFAFSGNTNTPLMGGWAIYDGDKIKLKGDIVIEPGTFPIELEEHGTFVLEKSAYNYTVYNRWKTFHTYKATLKKMWALNAKDDKEQIETYKKQLQDEKAEYISVMYKKSVDPVAKVLLAFEGRLYMNNNVNGSEVVNELKGLLPKHHLVKAMELERKKNIKK